jgi:hypothetical protein
MPRSWPNSLSLAAPALGAVLACALPAHGQSIEPRSYSPAPVGLNFLIVGYAQTSGGLALDILPITDASLKTGGPIMAYAHTFDLLGHSAKVDVVAPYQRLSGSAIYQGGLVSREVQGWADPAARLSVIFYGAPAESASAFRGYRQNLIVGGSVQVVAPLGQYDPTKLLNLGAHRWSVKPEIGVSKTYGPWILELSGAVTVYGANDDWFGGHRRTQAPLFGAQAHLVRTFRSGIWASVDTTFYTGGRSTVDGVGDNNLQRNWRLGGTLAFPVNRQTSVKLYASNGVSARTGNSYDLIGAALQYRWGGGF